MEGMYLVDFDFDFSSWTSCPPWHYIGLVHFFVSLFLLDFWILLILGFLLCLWKCKRDCCKVFLNCT
jgi:hypothetical protein